MIYYLNVKNCKKLIERLNCETFYHNVGDKKKVLERFVNEKQQIVVVTNAFRMGINVVDIKVIVHINESRIMLDYAQESGRAGQDGKRSKAIVVWGRIGAAAGRRGGRGGGGGRGGRENEGEKQMKWKKVIKFLEARCWKVALDRYLDGRENWMDCKKKKKQCQRCGGKGIEEEEVEEKEIKEIIKEEIEEKIKERIEKKIEGGKEERKMNEKINRIIKKNKWIREKK